MPDFPGLLADVPAASPLPFALNSKRGLRLDLSAANPRLLGLDTADTPGFSAWVRAELERNGADYGAGGYGENRPLYRMSPVFEGGGEEARSLHLGIDLWLAAGTPVHAVLTGHVHSLQDNASFGDYGPTLIFEHHLLGKDFYTLYGHLSRKSLERLRPGHLVQAGECIGALGEEHENLGWPPHLHFQVIHDLEGRSGDYPGVCKPSEAAFWLANCPDPNLLLRMDCLRK